ncbi:DUF4262 domain-containing protein [Streptomyces sp. TRM43335]|uniref:DUF4262 domain-containing protein n=1 Tax=Streptomyces taklimakanensis TaxID=2569853 RepID=A0A6G2B9F7_9ACTN|nr:DUF4262 domain-containing protein [Streptomyces taklimakanensis]MTE18864.1 DUF4262 domain-containing protein [Streptomyces taklimakanensis]
MDESPCFCLLCAPTQRGGPAWEERDGRIAKNVADFGWHVMGVMAGGDAPDDWGYSIGLWHTLRSPEVSVFGLPSQTAMRVVNAAGAAIRDGERLQPDQRRGDVLNGYDVAVRPVHPSWYPDFFGAGIDFHQTPPLPVAQLFWPDKAGRFPWEEEAEDHCRAGQPLLWIPKEDSDGPWADLAPET